MRLIDFTDPCPGTYQANTFSEGIGECIEYIHREVQPFCQPDIATLRSIEFLDLLLKQSESATGRVAGLELGSERVRQKGFLCASLIFFQRIIEV